MIRNAWDRNPWSLGSYALIKPGQYTSFYGVEAEPRGHVYFAGEHTSLESQGYLNGGVESGMRAAGEVLASLGAKVESRVSDAESVGASQLRQPYPMSAS